MNLPVKPAGAQQCLVQNVCPVGGGHHDHALVGTEAVHFHQQLVQGLLALVVAAAQAGAALAAHRINLINKDDAGHILLRLVEQIAHTGGTHAHVHLHKV